MKDVLIDFLRTININNYQSIRESNIGENLSYSDIVQLSIISQKKHMTIGDLGKALNLSKPATTQKVNELVAKGLVEKVQSSHDKRVVYLRFTDFLADTCKETSIEELIFKVEDNFSKDEKESFYKILEFMTVYLKDNRNSHSEHGTY